MSDSSVLVVIILAVFFRAVIAPGKFILSPHFDTIRDTIGTEEQNIIWCNHRNVSRDTPDYL